MKTRPKDEIDKAVALMEQIRKSGAMGPDVYHKCIVGLAYEYIMADQQQEGLIQLSRVPESYYRDVQLKQMQEDKLYAETVILLSYRLIQMGVVDGSEDLYVPTMALARA